MITDLAIVNKTEAGAGGVIPFNRKKVSEVFIHFEESYRKARTVHEKIKSFEDIETYMLRGQGLSPNTYRVYMTAVRQLYELTEGLSPFQIEPGHIERFYEKYRKNKKGKLSSVRYKISALKKFFGTMEKNFPGYLSPFKTMDKALLKKLSKKKGPKKQRALQPEEYEALLAYLENKDDKDSRAIYLLVKFLVATGLRIAEACSLTWGDMYWDKTDKEWTCSGTGKGDEVFEQEIIFPEVVDMLKDYGKEVLGRAVRKTDPVLWTRGKQNRRPQVQLYPNAAWVMIRDLGAAAEADGIITRDFVWSPHLFRRTIGTVLDKAGMSPVGIQHFLRHKSISTTADHYIDNTESARPYIEKLMGNQEAEKG